LSPEEWGELTARMIAAKPDPKKRSFDWGSIIPAPVVVPILSSLSDRRLKTNIVHRETREDGLRIYEFSYAGFTNRWRGEIAQDVLLSHPTTVVENDDAYLSVNYSDLNVSLQAT
jgi:hypothetical protein